MAPLLPKYTAEVLLLSEKTNVAVPVRSYRDTVAVLSGRCCARPFVVKTSRSLDVAPPLPHPGRFELASVAQVPLR
eukprot:SAG31_NODE_1790_length_7264_cov_3.356455_8_plen_76_part_00